MEERDIISPIDRLASTEEKVRQLQALSDENKPLVEHFLKTLDTELGTKSEISFKAPEDIAYKAKRPSIKGMQDWFDVEHVRDAFRFKTPVENLTELLTIVNHLKASVFEILKVDVDKLLTPKGRGWRMAAIDLRAPNGQIIEYQILPHEMNEAGKMEHSAYKQWREMDVTKMSREKRDAKDDVDKSAANLYRQAWASYLARTKQTPESVKQLIDKTRQMTQE